MSVSKSINWIGAFLKDKIVELAFLFTKTNELDPFDKRKEYNENFLNDFDHQDIIRVIWCSLLDEQLPIDVKKVNKIYRLNFIHLFDWSLDKVIIT